MDVIVILTVVGLIVYFLGYKVDAWECKLNSKTAPVFESLNWV